MRVLPFWVWLELFDALGFLYVVCFGDLGVYVSGVRDVMIAVLVILVGYFGLCVLVCWVFYLWFGVIYTFASLFWVGLVFWFSEPVLLDDLGGYVRLRWCLHMLLGGVVGGEWDSVGGFCDLRLFAYAIGAGR